MLFYARSALAFTERAIARNDCSGTQEWRHNAIRWSSSVEARVLSVDGQYVCLAVHCVLCDSMIYLLSFSAADARASCDEK